MYSNVDLRQTFTSATVIDKKKILFFYWIIVREKP